MCGDGLSLSAGIALKSIWPANLMSAWALIEVGRMERPSLILLNWYEWFAGLAAWLQIAFAMNCLLGLPPKKQPPEMPSGNNASVEAWYP